MSEQLYTVDEAAALLHTSRATIYREMRGGALSYRRVGKRRKIAQRDIDAYLAASLVERR